MVQKDKELLLKDLCSRFPYGVKCAIVDKDLGFGGIPGFEGKYPFVIDGITQEGDDIDVWVEHGNFSLETVKPYLFPLSSMTDELWDKEFRGCGITEFTRDSFKYDCETLEFNNSNPNLSNMVRFINQLIKNHFDIYGLIEKGLAIDATGLNIY